MKVLLADDHALVRGGLRLILEKIAPGSQVFEAADGAQALQMARQHEPDVCLLDITMPGLNGLDALPRLLQASPRTRVLVVSMHSGREFVTEALRAGAHGYLLKDAAVDELAQAVTALREGRPYLCKQLADGLLSDYLRDANQPTDSLRAAVPAGLLTPRQREVLQLLAEGHSTRAMALRMHVSVKTVETHRAEIMRRLDIWEVAGLTKYAVRSGLVAL
jgi:DNA-binding NarL/FixJ family response regulator